MLPWLQPYLERLANEQQVFSVEELQELCEERLLQMWSKTKEANKLTILLKYLSTMFEIDLLAENDSKKTARFTTIPKRLLQWSKDTSTQPIVTIKGLEKQLWSTILFEQAELQIQAWSKIALIGKNGAGKSTLLKLLLWREEADTGEITIQKDVKIGFLSQDIFRENASRSVLEEMLTALPEITQAMKSLDSIDRRIEAHDPDSVHLLDEQAEITEWLVHNDGFVLYDLQKTILRGFWFTDDQLGLPISQLSGGEQTKVQIAKFLLQQVDLLILDEPTNHLDIEWIVFLEQFCEARGKTLICISHDKRFLNTVFDQVVEISNHQLYRYKGNYDDYLDQKIAAFEQQSKEFKNQQKYLDQQEAFINRFRYKASKATQVQSRIKQLDKLEKIDAPEDMHTARSLTLKRSEKRLPETILTLFDAVVGYQKTTPLVSLPKKLEVTKSMQIGIIGKNGVGKTTLIKSILWEEALLAGSVKITPNLIIGSYAQIVESMNGANTIMDELLGPGASMKEILGILWSLSVSAEKAQQRIATLSWGEKAKVALTKMLLSKPDVIIMDEPTNHLDILSKESITMMLQQFSGISIIISHDRDFLSQVSNVIWVIQDKALKVYEDVEKGFGVIG
jgi:ATP-binding cassette, subfamily F, member 3